MTTVFIKLLNMSIAASWLVLAVILFRIILKNVPKWIRCILWGIVAIRLICPISIESMFSLLPSVETIPQDIMYVEKPALHTGITAINSAVNPYIYENMAPGIGDSVNPMQVLIIMGTVFWVMGITGMFLYAFVSYMRIKNRTDVSLYMRENIYLCDYINIPFVLGILHPRIYLPSALAEDDKVDFVIAHEKAHIRRHDHWWKPLGFLLLTIYWFNPIIWVAYILLCRDIELACDEYVISSLKEREKKAYSEALLSSSIKISGFSRNMISACPLAFGEVGVKDRVKEVLHYRKPAFWLVFLGILVCIIVAVCFLTNPKENTSNPFDSGHGFRIDKPEEILGMSYRDFCRLTGMTAEHYHANFYKVVIPNTEISAIFLAEGWDEKAGMSMLEKDDLVIRLECKLGALMNELADNMSLADFIKNSMWSDKILDYTLEQGAGTAYYLEEQYVTVRYDLDGDKVADRILQVALDDAECISEESDCWYTYPLTEEEERYEHMTIEALLEEITTETETLYDSIQDYKFDQTSQYLKLISFGEDTLHYCFEEFLEGGHTDLRGQIMASLCKEIMIELGETMMIDTETAHGQEWFDMFFAMARSIEKRYTEEDLKIYHPGSWHLLKIADMSEIEGKKIVPKEELDWEKILKEHLRNE